MAEQSSSAGRTILGVHDNTYIKILQNAKVRLYFYCEDVWASCVGQGYKE
jgi:hypothetical protein